MGSMFDCCRKKQKSVKMKPEEINSKKNIFSFALFGKKREMSQVGQDVYDEIFPDLGKNIKFIHIWMDGWMDIYTTDMVTKEEKLPF